jgi:hypothetical protein
MLIFRHRAYGMLFEPRLFICFANCFEKETYSPQCAFHIDEYTTFQFIDTAGIIIEQTIVLS